MRKGSVLKIALVGLVGLVGASAATMGGYRAVTGKCLLTGLCGSESTDQAVVTPVAATSGQEEACALGCSESKVAVETVAHAHETECAEKATECADKAATCADMAATCSEKVTEVAAAESSCCQGEAGEEACGGECSPEGCDKPDCCKKVAQNTATEKVGG